VEPDLYAEDIPLNDLDRSMWRKRLFFKYALKYGEANPGLALPIHFEDAEVDSFYVWMSDNDLIPETKLNDWVDDMDDLLDSTSLIYPDMLALKDSLSALEDVYEQEAFQEIKFQILAGLEREMARVVGGNGARISASLKHDRVVLKAMEILSSEEQVQEILAGPSE